jgi:hypothetical protein
VRRGEVSIYNEEDGDTRQPYPTLRFFFFAFNHRVLTAWRAASRRCSGVRAPFTASAPMRATSEIVNTFGVLTKYMVRDF